MGSRRQRGYNFWLLGKHWPGCGVETGVGWLYIDLGLGATPKCDAGYVTMQNRALNILPLPQLRNLLLDPAPYKLLVLAGPCLEETGELLLQTGGFSPRHFLQVLGDKEVSCLLPTQSPEALNLGSFPR